MKKVVNGNTVSFYENDEEIMHMDYISDEFTWYFNSSNEITLTSDDELYDPLNNLMSQEYNFAPLEGIVNSKTSDELVWHSDCFYRPDDEWSIKSVSYLTIKRVDDTFKLKCTKPLDSIYERKSKFHVICFSPGGNGYGSENVQTGSSLQDDVVTMLYYPLRDNKKKKFPN